MLINILQCH